MALKRKAKHHIKMKVPEPTKLMFLKLYVDLSRHDLLHHLFFHGLKTN